MQEENKVIVSDFRLKMSFLLSKKLPLLFSFLMALIVFLPISVSFMPLVRPPLVFVCLFYFAVYAPEMLTVTEAFFLGLLTDFLSFSPLGLETFSMTLMYLLSYYQRRFLYTHSFPFLWSVFVVQAAGVLLLKWGLACLILKAWTPVVYDLMQWLLLCAFYPFVVGVCAKIYFSVSDDLI
jgi:rod shape-determining protein MreD